MQAIIGLDEVGRGALAGPLVVGAVSLATEDLRTELEKLLRRPLSDSKHLTRLQREKVVAFAKDTTSWGIGEAEAPIIDKIGLTAATRLAAGRALDAVFKQTPRQQVTKVIADAGLFHPYETELPTERFVRADETYLPVMLASIFAKVHRDALLRELAETYPQYGWETNVGYGTLAHREAVQTYGATPLHRQTFLK